MILFVGLITENILVHSKFKLILMLTILKKKNNIMIAKARKSDNSCCYNIVGRAITNNYIVCSTKKP